MSAQLSVLLQFTAYLATFPALRFLALFVAPLATICLYIFFYTRFGGEINHNGHDPTQDTAEAPSLGCRYWTQHALPRFDIVSSEVGDESRNIVSIQVWMNVVLRAIREVFFYRSAVTRLSPVESFPSYSCKVGRMWRVNNCWATCWLLCMAWLAWRRMDKVPDPYRCR
jgi:hypothetical protein